MTGGSAVAGIKVVTDIGQMLLIFGVLFLLGVCLYLISQIVIKKNGPRRLFTVMRYLGLTLVVLSVACPAILMRFVSIERPREVSLRANLSLDLSAPLTEAVSQQPEVVTYEKSEDFFRGKLETPEYYIVEEQPFNQNDWGRPLVKNKIDVSLANNGRTVEMKDWDGVSLYSTRQRDRIGSLFLRSRKQATWTSKEHALFELSAQGLWLCNEISQLFLATQATDFTSCEALLKDAVGSPLTASVRIRQDYTMELELG